MHLKLQYCRGVGCARVVGTPHPLGRRGVCLSHQLFQHRRRELLVWATGCTCRRVMMHDDVARDCCQLAKLPTVARSILGVPAASTSSERAFSIAGRTVDERRTQLSGDSLDGLLFIHGLN